MGNTDRFFIHGWASNSEIWGNSAANAYYYSDPLFPDLANLKQVFLNTCEHNNKPITVIGWSLGGMLALELAQLYPEKLAKVVLVSSTARFTIGPEYDAGLSPSIVKRLSRQLNQDKSQTLIDFYKLMFSAQEEDQIDLFLDTVAPRFTDINLDSLQAGLQYLLETDLRPMLSSIKLPCAIVHGMADSICPVKAARHLAENLPKAKLHLLEGVGHIPFYTCRREFEIFIEECIRQ